MSTDASWPLQNAISDALSGHQTLGAYLDLDASPNMISRADTETALPRLVLGDSESRAWRSATFDGQEHEISLHLWSSKGGSGESKKIASMVIELLHDADLPLPGHALVDLQFESSETRHIPASDQYHCLLTFKGLTVSD